jgi:hypothetical protein
MDRVIQDLRLHLVFTRSELTPNCSVSYGDGQCLTVTRAIQFRLRVHPLVNRKDRAHSFSCIAGISHHSHSTAQKRAISQLCKGLEDDWTLVSQALERPYHSPTTYRVCNDPTPRYLSMFHQHMSSWDSDVGELGADSVDTANSAEVQEHPKPRGKRMRNLTWIYPLSIPSLPIFFPISPIMTPGFNWKVLSIHLAHQFLY